MIFPLPQEQAILTINGQDYKEWETVQVKHTLAQPPYYTFRFTCSEGMPLAQNLAKLQIIPGDLCTITLAGEKAFEGLVYERQVFYDGTKHYIQIQGASKILGLSWASVVHEGMQFANKKPKEIITKLLEPHKIKLREEGGTLPDKEIDRLNIAPGTSVQNAVEDVIRQAGGYPMTTNVSGDLVVAIGAGTSGDFVTEGVDILEGRELIFNAGIAQGTFTMGSKPGTDEEYGTKAGHENFEKSDVASTIQQPLQQVITAEFPAYLKDALKSRGNWDRNFQNRDQVTVYITVYGWLKPGGQLWQRNQQVSVKSPMLVLNGSEKLTAKSVTFMQDNNLGTRTVLELCNDLAWAPVPSTA